MGHRNSVPSTHISPLPLPQTRFRVPSYMVRSSDDIRSVRPDPARKVSNLFASYDQLCQAVDGLDSAKTSQMFRPSKTPAPASQFSMHPIATQHFRSNPITTQHSYNTSKESNTLSQTPSKPRDFNERAVDCPRGFKPPTPGLSSPKVMRKNQNINSPKITRKVLGSMSPNVTRKKKGNKERCHTQ